MGDRLVVVAVQMRSKDGDIGGNLERMRRLALEASDALGRVHLVVFPELALSGFCAAPVEKAVPADGHHAEAMAWVAREIGGHIVYGFLERNEGRTYNSAVIVGGDGPVGVYRKVHLWGDEGDHLVPGDAYPVFALEWGRLGCMICYDLNFPEVARAIALQGALVAALPAAWDWPYLDGWELCLRARAYDNLLYLVAAGQWGSYSRGRLLGHSRIVGPDGKFLAALGDDGEGWCGAELDLKAREELERSGNRFLLDRRPETYGLLSAGARGAT